MRRCTFGDVRQQILLCYDLRVLFRFDQLVRHLLSLVLLLG